MSTVVLHFWIVSKIINQYDVISVSIIFEK